MTKSSSKKLEVFLEFLLFGIVVGVVEDLIAVTVATDETITWEIFGIIVLVAIPFAFLGEVIVDRSSFLHRVAHRIKKLL